MGIISFSNGSSSDDGIVAEWNSNGWVGVNEVSRNMIKLNLYMKYLMLTFTVIFHDIN